MWRRNVATENVLTAKAPSAKDWYNAAFLTNWVLGRGAVLVPSYYPQIGAYTASTDQIFYYRVAPRAQAVQRRLHVRMLSEAAQGNITVDVKFPETGSAVTMQVGEVAYTPHLVVPKERVA